MLCEQDIKLSEKILSRPNNIIILCKQDMFLFVLSFVFVFLCLYLKLLKETRVRFRASKTCLSLRSLRFIVHHGNMPI